MTVDDRIDWIIGALLEAGDAEFDSLEPGEVGRMLAPISRSPDDPRFDRWLRRRTRTLARAIGADRASGECGVPRVWTEMYEALDRAGTDNVLMLMMDEALPAESQALQRHGATATLANGEVVLSPPSCRWGGFAVFLVLAVFVGIGIFVAESLPVAFFSGALAALSLYAAYRSSQSRIVISEKGVVAYLSLFVRHVRWCEVDNFFYADKNGVRAYLRARRLSVLLQHYGEREGKALVARLEAERQRRTA
jgi:hypothetical protein